MHAFLNCIVTYRVRVHGWMSLGRFWCLLKMPDIFRIFRGLLQYVLNVVDQECLYKPDNGEVASISMGK